MHFFQKPGVSLHLQAIPFLLKRRNDAAFCKEKWKNMRAIFSLRSFLSPKMFFYKAEKFAFMGISFEKKWRNQTEDTERRERVVFLCCLLTCVRNRSFFILRWLFSSKQKSKSFVGISSGFYPVKEMMFVLFLGKRFYNGKAFLFVFLSL